MPVCVAYDCNIGSKRNLPSNFRLFRFPKGDPYRRRLWVLAVRRENFEPTNQSKLCNRHFVSGQPCKDKGDVDYVPTLFSYNNYTRPETDKRVIEFGKLVEKKRLKEQKLKSTNIGDNKLYEAFGSASVKDVKSLLSFYGYPTDVELPFNEHASPSSEVTNQNIVSGNEIVDSTDSETDSDTEVEYNRTQHKVKLDVLKIILITLEGKISQEIFDQRCRKITPSDFDKLAMERHYSNMCSYPMCSNYLSSENKEPINFNCPVGVNEIRWRRYFCSMECNDLNWRLKSQLSKLLIERDRRNPLLKLVKPKKKQLRGKSLLASKLMNQKT